jgi:hypothetical protein
VPGPAGTRDGTGDKFFGKRRRLAHQPFHQHGAKYVESDLASGEQEPSGAGFGKRAVIVLWPRG